MARARSLRNRINHLRLIKTLLDYGHEFSFTKLILFITFNSKRSMKLGNYTLHQKATCLDSSYMMSYSPSKRVERTLATCTPKELIHGFAKARSCTICNARELC